MDGFVITRHRHGRGFTYRHKDGATLKDLDLRKWIEDLSIPPAWSDVEIFPRDNKVLVTGRDDDNRKQYIYNPSWERKRNRAKYLKLIRFAESIEDMRKITDKHLRSKTLNHKKVLAGMVRLIDQVYFRPGHDYYANVNDSYGLTTLRSKHLEINGDKLTFNYSGKSGKEHSKLIDDTKLVELIMQLNNMPGYKIFTYKDGNKDTVSVNSVDLNNYIREAMGEDFSAKNFRTWAGTLIAAKKLNELGVSRTEKEKKQTIRVAIDRVAEELGNTSAVAKSSYIAPQLIDEYKRGVTLQNLYGKTTDKKYIDRDEQALLLLLKAAQNKED